ncbi:hypothetical protein BLNAU_8883 [Blattamonas nauphoetae]|uniref:Uncharacterized protein n=1 Tax=Blattamonas nauphoetae TaxID=2049346 RepID=A0ABQ9XX85_9EUKA|nr:hypothetical protein BLNAU_8883 [Blattamonas nauphoetae]
MDSTDLTSFFQRHDSAVIRLRLSSLLINKPSKCFVSVRMCRQNTQPVEMTSELSSSSTSEPIFRWNSFDFLSSLEQTTSRHKLRLSVANIEPVNNISTHSPSTTTRDASTPSGQQNDFQIIPYSSTTFPLGTIFTILKSVPSLPVFAPSSADYLYAVQTIPDSLQLWLKGGVKGIQLSHKELNLASKLSNAYSAQNSRLVYALLNDPHMTPRTREIVKKMSYHSGITSIIPSNGFPQRSSYEITNSGTNLSDSAISQAWMTFGDIFADEQISGLFLLEFTLIKLFPSIIALPREISLLPQQSHSNHQLIPAYCPVKIHICFLWAEANGEIRNPIDPDKAEKPDALDTTTTDEAPNNNDTKEVEDNPPNPSSSVQETEKTSHVLPRRLHIQARTTDVKGEFFESREGDFEAAENVFRKGHVRLFQERAFFYQSTTLVSDRRAPLVISLVSREKKQVDQNINSDVTEITLDDIEEGRKEPTFITVDYPLLTAAFSIRQSSSVLDYGVRFVRLVDEFLGCSLFFTISITPLNRILRPFNSPMLEVNAQISTPLLTNESSMYPPLLVTRVTTNPLELWNYEHFTATKNFPDLPKLSVGYPDQSLPFICIPVKHTFDTNPKLHAYDQYVAKMKEIVSWIRKSGPIDYSSFWTDILNSDFIPDLSECVLPMYMHGEDVSPPVDAIQDFSQIIPSRTSSNNSSPQHPHPSRYHSARLPLPPPDLIEAHYALLLPPADKSVAGVDIITNDVWASMDFHTYIDAKDALSPDLCFVAQFFAPLIRQETRSELLHQGLISILEMEEEQETNDGKEKGDESAKKAAMVAAQEAEAARMEALQRLFTFTDLSIPTFLLCKAIAFHFLQDNKNPLVRETMISLRLRHSVVSNQAVPLCSLDINNYNPIQIACHLVPIKGYIERQADLDDGSFVLEDEIEDEFGETQLITVYTDVMEEVDLEPYVVVLVGEEEEDEGEEYGQLLGGFPKIGKNKVVSFDLLGLGVVEREEAVASIQEKVRAEIADKKENNGEEVFQMMKDGDPEDPGAEQEKHDSTQKDSDRKQQKRKGRDRTMGISEKFVADQTEVDEAEKEIEQEMMNDLAENIKVLADELPEMELSATEFDMTKLLDMTKMVMESSNETIQVNREQERLSRKGISVTDEEREAIREKVREREEKRKIEEEKRMEEQRLLEKSKQEIENQKKDAEKRKKEELVREREAKQIEELRQQEEKKKQLEEEQRQEEERRKEEERRREELELSTKDLPGAVPAAFPLVPQVPIASIPNPVIDELSAVSDQLWMAENLDEDDAEEVVAQNKKASKRISDNQGKWRDENRGFQKARSKHRRKGVTPAPSPPSTPSPPPLELTNTRAARKKPKGVFSRLSGNTFYLFQKLGIDKPERSQGNSLAPSLNTSARYSSTNTSKVSTPRNSKRRSPTTLDTDDDAPNTQSPSPLPSALSSQMSEDDLFAGPLRRQNPQHSNQKVYHPSPQSNQAFTVSSILSPQPSTSSLNADLSIPIPSSHSPDPNSFAKSSHQASPNTSSLLLQSVQSSSHPPQQSLLWSQTSTQSLISGLSPIPPLQPPSQTRPLVTISSGKKPPRPPKMRAGDDTHTTDTQTSRRGAQSTHQILEDDSLLFSNEPPLSLSQPPNNPSNMNLTVYSYDDD